MRLDGWLLAVCIARTCMTSVFMTYAAVLPVLRTQWDMSATAAGSISTGFQLGYAVALVAFSALADCVGTRRVFLRRRRRGAGQSWCWEAAGCWPPTVPRDWRLDRLRVVRAKAPSV